MTRVYPFCVTERKLRSPCPAAWDCHGGGWSCWVHQLRARTASLSKKWVRWATMRSVKSWGCPDAAFSHIPGGPGLPSCPWGGSSTTWGSCSQCCVPCLIHACREWGLFLVSVFSGRRGRECPSGWERGSNRHGTITSQPILPNLPCPTGSCLQTLIPSLLQHCSLPFSLPKSCCTRAGPCQERPIPALAQASEGQARGDTSRDSPLILAKPLQSPTAQTQTRLLESLIKLKKLWPDPYGNGNTPSLAQSLSSHIGFQVPLSKYGSIRSFQRKDFLNYSNTEKK